MSLSIYISLAFPGDIAPQFQNTQNRSPLLNSFPFWVTKVNVSQSQSIKVHGSETIPRLIPLIHYMQDRFGNPDHGTFLTTNDLHYEPPWVSRRNREDCKQNRKKRITLGLPKQT